jgi:hypothetical protein
MIAFGNSIAAFAGLAGHDPEAIVLDFVQPDGAGRWPAGIIAMAIVRYPLILKVVTMPSANAVRTAGKL